VYRGKGPARTRSTTSAGACASSTSPTPVAVTAHLVAPGPADTDRLRRLSAEQAGSRGLDVEEVLAERRAESPLGRLVTPEQVAWAVLERIEAASPVDAIDVAADELATTLGARGVSLLLADLSGQVLVRLGHAAGATGGRTQGTEHAESVPLAGTVYEEVLRTQQVAVRELDEGTRVTAPVTVSAAT
jgi:hypothetical protein